VPAGAGVEEEEPVGVGVMPAGLAALPGTLG